MREELVLILRKRVYSWLRATIRRNPSSKTVISIMYYGYNGGIYTPVRKHHPWTEICDETLENKKESQSKSQKIIIITVDVNTNVLRKQDRETVDKDQTTRAGTILVHCCTVDGQIINKTIRRVGKVLVDLIKHGRGHQQPTIITIQFGSVVLHYKTNLSVDEINHFLPKLYAN